jgi:hypothetical protein
MLRKWIILATTILASPTYALAQVQSGLQSGAVQRGLQSGAPQSGLQSGAPQSGFQNSVQGSAGGRAGGSQSSGPPPAGNTR